MVILTSCEIRDRGDIDLNDKWVRYNDIKHLLNAPKNTIHNIEYEATPQSCVGCGNRDQDEICNIAKCKPLTWSHFKPKQA